MLVQQKDFETKMKHYKTEIDNIDFSHGLGPEYVQKLQTLEQEIAL